MYVLDLTPIIKCEFLNVDTHNFVVVKLLIIGWKITYLFIYEYYISIYYKSHKQQNKFILKRNPLNIIKLICLKFGMVLRKKIVCTKHLVKWEFVV